ncbi:hypothetical protein D3C84_1296440 [compost metagenome]
MKHNNGRIFSEFSPTPVVLISTLRSRRPLTTREVSAASGALLSGSVTNSTA